jgi:hypothetical protein
MRGYARNAAVGRRAPAWLGWAGCALLPVLGCTSVRHERVASADRTSVPLTVDAITAPVTGHGEHELDRLKRVDSPAAQLREAWILLEVGRTSDALSILNRIVFGDREYGDAVEALARFVRAEAFERNGETERAEYERQRALAATVDPALRGRLEATSKHEVASPAAHISILPRTAWNARPARRSRMQPMGRVTRITVHHSANVTSETSERASIAAIRSIQRHHQDRNGWGDIGYHFLIDPAGRIWTGRALEWQGAHAGDGVKNRYNVGVCLLGNFTPSSQGSPPRAEARALELLVRALCARYHVPAGNIKTHRELNATACPGPYVQAMTERIRARLAAPAAPAGKE